MEPSRSRLWPEPLAEAGAGSSISNPSLRLLVLISRSPAGAFLAANLERTSRRWRLFFVRLNSQKFVAFFLHGAILE